jgi:hypothetical protein
MHFKLSAATESISLFLFSHCTIKKIKNEKANILTLIAFSVDAVAIMVSTG